MNKLQLMVVGMLFATQAFADRAPADPPPASTPAPVVKEPAKPATSGPVAKAEPPKADTKTGGCSVDPAANASAMFGLLAVGLLLRRKKSGR
jgi:MYXO-CTERM domain-containing protein